MYREDILLHAYRVSRAARGAPGVDGVRFEDIDAAGVAEWLAGLRRALQDKTYRPDPVRRVLIPKPDGGERPLGIPTIRNRVVPELDGFGVLAALVRDSPPVPMPEVAMNSP